MDIRDILYILIIVIVWVVLVRFVFPRLGVPT